MTNTDVMHSDTREPEIDVLRRMARVEQALVQMYGRALDEADGEEVPHELERVRAEHEDSVRTLTDLLQERGGEPPREAGARGRVADATERLAQSMGQSTGLKALREAELLARRRYERDLAEQELSHDVQAFLTQVLLPKQAQHVDALERLVERE